jgi:hypothetical protein
VAGTEQSSLVIKELTGLKRVVTLRGPSLPFQGATWGGLLRVTTTWYPGNAAEATQSVMGPADKPSTWVGAWRTPMMLRTPALFSEGGGSDQYVVQAFTLATLLDDIFRLGQRLRVEWQNTVERSTDSALTTQTHRIVREGRCVDWDWDYDRADDIEWTVTFDWASRGARQQKVVTRRNENIAGKLTAMEIALADAVAVLESNALVSSDVDVVNSANTLSLGDLENIADFPADTFQQFTRTAQLISNRFKHIGDLIAKVRAIPLQLANQALDVANNTVAIASQFIDTMSRQPPELNVARVKVSQLSKATEFFNDGITQAEIIRNAAQGLKTVVEDRALNEKTILAVHVVRGVVDIPDSGQQGELLANVSTHYYKTPDHAATIAQANLLPVNQMFAERGSVLIIPTLDAVKQFSPQGG